ncbi:MAG: hypothetical protein A2182_03145 [Candidatus Pacebacteria bacterium RIFOXYA1_FULL_38_18]|nr:MAG: hypothetical protein A2182_03145 [Candidatus Pacebacteria bacterium RIFOXYA1_FULL_38_18]OGJ39468.1 MAG: hypothetical protein A2411_01785 [Candidatus Pacebacteria bacterium RIFOXYC1_FULL_39_21]
MYEKIKKYFIKIIKYIKKHGLIWTFKISLYLIYSRFIYPKFITFINIFTVDYLIHKRRMKISSLLAKQMNDTIGYGPFKGLIIKHRNDWNGNMFLGIYEQEVLQLFQKFPKKYNTLINIGAADGYYAIGGLVSGLFNKTYCFELSKKSRINILKNAILNRVQNDIKIFGIAKSGFTRKLKKAGANLEKSIIICDIEGNEFELFNKQVFGLFKKSILVIEVHDWHENGKSRYKKLKKNAGRYFKIQEIQSGTRDLSIFPEIKNLKDNDRWLLCSEGRHYAQTWLILKPKKSNFKN